MAKKVTKKKTKAKLPTNKGQDPIDGFTVREKAFALNYLECGNAYQAAIDAGYSMGISGYENLRKPKFAYLLQAYYDKVGLTDEKITKRLREGIDAEKVVATEIDNEGNSKLIKEADMYVRHRYIETALKLKGRFEPHIEAGQVAVTNQILIQNIIQKAKEVEIDA